jgi:hypothetical protein
VFERCAYTLTHLNTSIEDCAMSLLQSKERLGTTERTDGQMSLSGLLGLYVHRERIAISKHEVAFEHRQNHADPSSLGGLIQ